MIEIKASKKLTGAKGTFVLSLDQHIKQGEVIGLFGPSGSGKTTLLKLIAGLLQPEEGTLKYDGREISIRQPPITGFVFQDYALFPNMTILENLSFASKKNTPERVQEIIELLELEELRSMKPAHLSGGQRQRVAMGRAFLANTKTWLLDEPFSALDTKLKQKLISYIRTKSETGEYSIVISSHNLDDLRGLCSRFWQVDYGQIEEKSQLLKNTSNQILRGEVVEVKEGSIVVQLGLNQLELKTEIRNYKVGQIIEINAKALQIEA